MGTTSAEFARLRGVLAVRLVERRRALATWNALRDTQAFRDWGFALFQHHALFKACREAEWAAREAAEDLFVRKADTDAERNLQRLAIGVYERELGDTLRLARKHFAPETLA
jgi:hypothetical protein